MERLGVNLDVDQQQPGNQGQQTSQLSAQEERRMETQRCTQRLVHASNCHEQACQSTGCAKMKKVIEHTKSCKRRTSSAVCRICQVFNRLCGYHAKHCLERKCVVPFCGHIKDKLRQQQMQQRMHQNQTAHRPNATMQSRDPPPVGPPVMPQQQLPGGMPPHPVIHQNNPQQMHQQPPPYVAQQPQAPQKPAGPPAGAVRAAQQVARDARMQAVQATIPSSTPVQQQMNLPQQMYQQQNPTSMVSQGLGMQGMMRQPASANFMQSNMPGTTQAGVPMTRPGLPSPLEQWNTYAPKQQEQQQMQSGMYSGIPEIITQIMQQGPQQQNLQQTMQQQNLQQSMQQNMQHGMLPGMQQGMQQEMHEIYQGMQQVLQQNMQGQYPLQQMPSVSQPNNPSVSNMTQQQMWQDQQLLQQRQQQKQQQQNVFQQPQLLPFSQMNAAGRRAQMEQNANYSANMMHHNGQPSQQQSPQHFQANKQQQHLLASQNSPPMSPQQQGLPSQSPRPVMSPKPHQVASPRAQMSPHQPSLTSPRPIPSPHQTQTPLDQSQLTDKPMLSQPHRISLTQLQPLDPELQLNQDDTDAMAPLTPQDQLTKFVETL